MTKKMTFHRCRLDDEALGASLSIDLSDDDPGHDADLHARLAAFSCERCGALVDHTLTLDGGDAVCDGCVQSSGPNEDPDLPPWDCPGVPVDPGYGQ